MDDNSVKRNTLVSHMKHTIPSSCCCNLKWNGYHPPPLPPRPSSSPNPNPNPDPTLNRTTPFHPPARPIIIESGSSKIPKDNALFRHVYVATNLGELTLIESTIILFAKYSCGVHTTHAPCSDRNTAMLNSTVSIYKWTIICFNQTRLFPAMNEAYRHHVAAI